MKRTLSIILAVGLALAITIIAAAAENQIIVDSSENAGVVVYGPLTAYAPPNDPAWGSPTPAVLAWTAASWPLIPGNTSAKWISNTYKIEPPVGPSTWRWFSKTIPLCSGATNIHVVITATADNAEAVYVNGTLIGSDGEVQGPSTDDHEWGTIKEYTADPADANSLKLDFIVRNYAGSSIPETNPTGLLFSAVVDYDCIKPVVGFVTGGGWIRSPAGAYKANPDLAGRATFGFVAKYLKGRDVPKGSTEFQLRVGRLNFHSNRYEQLVVPDRKHAEFKGVGTINGKGRYNFQVWVTDGRHRPDTFRIKIWDQNGSVVYDNGTDQRLGQGSIVIHVKK